MNHPEPIWQVVGDDQPLSDEAIAALANLLLHLVEQKESTENEALAQAHSISVFHGTPHERQT